MTSHRNCRQNLHGSGLKRHLAESPEVLQIWVGIGTNPPRTCPWGQRSPPLPLLPPPLLPLPPPSPPQQQAPPWPPPWLRAPRWSLPSIRAKVMVSLVRSIAGSVAVPGTSSCHHKQPELRLQAAIGFSGTLAELIRAGSRDGIDE